MAGIPAGADGLNFPLSVLCLLSGLALAATALGATDVDGVPSTYLAQNEQTSLRHYDIPALPLAVALDRYAAVSGRPAVFASALVAGRLSAPVRGNYDIETALHLLLADTGLHASAVVSGSVATFVLKAQTAATSSAVNQAQVERERLAAFDGAAQAAVWQAFCRNANTMPGTYRALLRFRVDPAGRIYQARLLSSTGDAQRDAALLATLQGVHVATPPSDLPQPLTMLLLPHAAGQACGEGR